MPNNALSLVEGKIRSVKGENTLSLEFQLVSGRMAGRLTVHKEFDYEGDVLTGIEVWESPSKEELLLTFAFTYTGQNLTQKVVTDEISGATLTVSYGYTGSNLTILTICVAQ
jgi:hypothetical protein